MAEEGGRSGVADIAACSCGGQVQVRWGMCLPAASQAVKYDTDNAAACPNGSGVCAVGGGCASCEASCQI